MTNETNAALSALRYVQIQPETFDESKRPWLNDYVKSRNLPAPAPGKAADEGVEAARCKAVKIANNALYFSDSHDYKSALWEVCNALAPSPDGEWIGQQFIDDNDPLPEAPK